MVKLVRFIRTDEDTIMLNVPANLKGKFVEIDIMETNTEEIISDGEESLSRNSEVELQMLDKMRNQLNVWDI